MQVNLNDEREAIARIIDPGAAECRYKLANGDPTTVTKNGQPFAYWRNAWVMWGKSNWSTALAKADAILALRIKEPSRG